MGGGGNPVSAVTDAIGDLVDDVGNAVSDAVQDVGDAVSDVVNDVGRAVGNAAKDIGHVVEDVGNTAVKAVDDVAHFVGDVADVIGSGVEAVGKFAINTITNPGSILQDPVKAVTFAIAAVLALPTGGASVAWYAQYAALMAWTFTNSGAAYAMASKMHEKGWIDATTAVILSTVANLAASYYGYSTSFEAYDGGQVFVMMHQSLTAIGVSESTAISIAYNIMQAGYWVSSMSSWIGAAMSIIDIYGVYTRWLEMEQAYMAALAAFEAWLKKFQERTNKEDSFIASFINGEFMKYYPGQPMFAATMPAREYYPSVEGTQPGMVMLGDGLLNSDIFVARMTFSNPYYDFPGNSSYMNSIQDYPKFWRSSI
jgi:hypothetical protein